MSELPTGSITFLFTDIEASTSLWEQDPDGMKHALVHHDEVLKSTFDEHGGYVFASAGDSFSVAFQAAGDAVRAALAAQQRLREGTDASRGIGALRVRMALHSGEADERDGDYFGPPLNRTARLLAAGHGGQILLSGAAAALVVDGLPAEARLTDLGEYQLEDLDRPEQVFQLTRPGLAATFTPLRTPSARTSNLPHRVTSFIGRRQDLVELEELLGDARLVTLLGAGGCGKTRLALEVAESVEAEFPDGVWFVDLAPVTEPSLVVSTAARAMGLTDMGEHPLPRLVDHLRVQRTLVVLDNCEHVLEPASGLVAETLRSAVSVRMLVTSREPLRVQGEVVRTVAPLPVPGVATPVGELLSFDSVRLFQERAEANRPGFRVTSDNGDAVREICRLLDGIPLGLELAAARLRALSVEEIAARLGRSLTVLGSTGTDVSSHQRTLEATLDWSFDLLDADAQTFLCRVAVFAGGWSLQEAEEVCSGDGIDRDQIVGLLSDLVDKSLVQVTESDVGFRYRLLEPIRQYALGKLRETGDEAALRRRHAAFFAQMAEDAFPALLGPDEVQWLDTLEANLDNLRAALDWHLHEGETQAGLLMAGALYRFWYRTQRDGEAIHRLEALLDADPTPGQPRARALLGRAALRGARPGLDDEAIEFYRRFGPEDELGVALNNRAVSALWVGDSALAAELYKECIASARQGGDDQLLVFAATNLSVVKGEWEGDLEAAAALAEESLLAAQRLGAPSTTHAALTAFGRLRMLQGDYVAAIAPLEDALEIEMSPRSRISNVGDSLRRLAQVAYRSGDPDQALRYLAQRHHQFEGLGGEPESRQGWQSSGLGPMGEVEIARGNHRRGVVLNAAHARLRAADHRAPSLSPIEQAQLDDALNKARETLGQKEFDEAWRDGSEMTLQEALEYAAAGLPT